MQFMVVERFRNGAKPVYRRFAEKGRMLPDGLVFVNSWVQDDLSRCFQLMECEDAALLKTWAGNWSDLIDFEFVAVVSSETANALAEQNHGR